MAFTARRLLPRSRALRAGLVALAALLALLLVGELAGWPFLREPLARQLQDGLRREVTFDGEFRLGLLGSVRLSAGALRVGSPADAPRVHDRAGRPLPFIDAREIALSVPYSTLWALLRGQAERPPQLRTLSVRSLALGLARSADGRSNWRIGPPQQEQDLRPTLPEFGHLVVEDGRLRLDDAQTGLLLDARLSTSEGRRAADPAGLQLTAVGLFRGTPLQARLQAAGLLPLAAPLDGAPPSVPLALTLRAGELLLQLRGHAGDLLRLAALDGALSLAGPSLAAAGELFGVTLPRSAPFELHGRLRKQGAAWDGTVERLVIGSSRLRGALRYDPQPPVPTLRGELGGERLALADFGQAPAGVAEPDPTPDKVLPRRELRLPPLDRIDAELALRLQRVELGGAGIGSLQPLNARLRLGGGRLALDQLHAGSGGGALRGALSADVRGDTQRWQAELNWSGLRLEQLVRVPKPAAAPDKGGAALAGVLSGRAQLHGRGDSTDELYRTLDGSVEAWLRDGRVSALVIELIGLDLVEALGVLASDDDSLPLRCGALRLLVRNGIVLPELALLDSADTTLLIGGQLSLPDERLDLKLTARPHDASAVSLRAPVGVRGTFADPQIDLPAGRIGLRAAAAAALAAAAGPLAALLALADLGEEERAVCGQALQHLRSTPR